MSDDMLKFVSISQQYPDKRTAKSRIKDFSEIYERFDPKKAAEQSSRCSQCGVPFCQVHCPLGNNIPDWLKLTQEGRFRDAYELSQSTNSFPEICGRICPQDRLCEGSCVIETGFQSVTIGAIETFLTEMAWEEGWVRPSSPLKESQASIGIIGAGPAGMAAADLLRAQGYRVTIYDRYDRAGGLLIYGIPNFKLEKEVVNRRVELLKKAGVQFKLNFEVGRDASLNDLKKNHDAILIATGVYKARKNEIEGSNLAGIIPAMSYLSASNKKGLGDHVEGFENGEWNAAGKKVVVIGGGDTAMDCVRTAIRQGAEKVTCLYRRDRTSMPGSNREVLHAEEEGVKFIWLAAPKAYSGPGRIHSVRAVKMRLDSLQGARQNMPREIPGSDFSLEADMVIEALGFEPEDIPHLFQEPDLAIHANGTIRVEPSSFMTNREGVFAAGDIVRGASLVVWAIKDGRESAQAIHRYLEGKTHLSVAAE